MFECRDCNNRFIMQFSLREMHPLIELNLRHPPQSVQFRAHRALRSSMKGFVDRFYSNSVRLFHRRVTEQHDEIPSFLPVCNRRIALPSCVANAAPYPVNILVANYSGLLSIDSEANRVPIEMSRRLTQAWFDKLASLENQTTRGARRLDKKSNKATGRLAAAASGRCN